MIAKILLYFVFLFVPLVPLFMPTEFSYSISRYLYIIHILICIILFFYIGTVEVVADKGVRKKNLIIKGSILLGLSLFGFLAGPSVLMHYQINKFDKIIKEANFQDKAISHEQKIVSPTSYSIRNIHLDLESENCVAKFRYMSGVLFRSDMNCDMVCCKGKPEPAGVPYEFVADGYHGYTWYRFCHI